MCKHYDPPMPYKFYFDICDLAFDFAEDYPKDVKIIHERYVTFLCVAMWCFERNKSIKPKYFKDKKLLKEMEAVSWKKYLEMYPNSRQYKMYKKTNKQIIKTN